MGIEVRDRHVAVLCGGVSNEREVSLHSGAAVAEALGHAGISYELIDTLDGAAAMVKLAQGGFDVAFIALHGKGGEDGAIQGALETLGIPYTGSGIMASAIAMNKSISKDIYRKAGLPVAESILLGNGESCDAGEVVSKLGGKVVVKPIGDGSSVGMSIVHDAGEFPAALQVAYETGQDVLVEAYIAGTEVTCAVLGNDDPEPLPVIMIVPHAEFYDYEHKYAAGGADHLVPAPIDDAEYAEVQRLALAAHQALGCSGTSRSDFIIDDHGVPYILETNTIPGMTSTSLLPDAAAHAGLDFCSLVLRLLELALEGVE